MRNTGNPDILGDQNIQNLKLFEELKDQARVGIAQQLIATKKYSQMDAMQRKTCVRYLVRESSTETELRNRLCEIGMEYFDIAWSDVNPGNQTALEAQTLVRALGGLVSKAGALVMVTTVEDQF